MPSFNSETNGGKMTTYNPFLYTTQKQCNVLQQNSCGKLLLIAHFCTLHESDVKSYNKVTKRNVRTQCMFSCRSESPNCSQRAKNEKQVGLVMMLRKCKPSGQLLLVGYTELLSFVHASCTPPEQIQ